MENTQSKKSLKVPQVAHKKAANWSLKIWLQAIGGLIAVLLLWGFLKSGGTIYFAAALPPTQTQAPVEPISSPAEAATNTETPATVEALVVPATATQTAVVTLTQTPVEPMATIALTEEPMATQDLSGFKAINTGKATSAFTYKVSGECYSVDAGWLMFSPRGKYTACAPSDSVIYLSSLDEIPAGIAVVPAGGLPKDKMTQSVISGSTVQGAAEYWLTKHPKEANAELTRVCSLTNIIAEPTIYKVIVDEDLGSHSFGPNFSGTCYVMAKVFERPAVFRFIGQVYATADLYHVIETPSSLKGSWLGDKNFTNMP